MILFISNFDMSKFYIFISDFLIIPIIVFFLNIYIDFRHENSEFVINLVQNCVFMI